MYGILLIVDMTGIVATLLLDVSFINIRCSKTTTDFSLSLFGKFHKYYPLFYYKYIYK